MKGVTLLRSMRTIIPLSTLHVGPPYPSWPPSETPTRPLAQNSHPVADPRALLSDREGPWAFCLLDSIGGRVFYTSKSNISTRNSHFWKKMHLQSLKPSFLKMSFTNWVLTPTFTINQWDVGHQSMRCLCCAALWSETRFHAFVQQNPWPNREPGLPP